MVTMVSALCETSTAPQPWVPAFAGMTKEGCMPVFRLPSARLSVASYLGIANPIARITKPAST